MTTVIAARNLSRRYSRGIVHGEKAIAAQSKQNHRRPRAVLAYDRKPGGRDDAGNHEGQHALGEKHATSPSCYAKGGVARKSRNVRQTVRILYKRTVD